MIKSSKVTYIKNSQLADNQSINIQNLEQMLNSGLAFHFSETNYKNVWKTLFKSQEIIAIKVNCLAGKGLSTHPELVQVIVAQLEKIGIPRNKQVNKLPNIISVKISELMVPSFSSSISFLDQQYISAYFVFIHMISDVSFQRDSQ